MQAVKLLGCLAACLACRVMAWGSVAQCIAFPVHHRWLSTNWRQYGYTAANSASTHPCRIAVMSWCSPSTRTRNNSISNKGNAKTQFKDASSRTGNSFPVVAQASLVLTKSLISQEVRNGIDRNKSQRNELWLDLGGREKASAATRNNPEA